MVQKKHKPEEIVLKLRQVDVLLSQGRPVAEAIQVKRLKELILREALGKLSRAQPAAAGPSSTSWRSLASP